MLVGFYIYGQVRLDVARGEAMFTRFTMYQNLATTWMGHDIHNLYLQHAAKY